jgi:peptide deformylase
MGLYADHIMPKLNVVRIGHPALRARSASVTKKELTTKKFQTFLDNLAQLCDESKGVGIAAPQVGINKRVIVVHVDPKNPRYPNKKPFPLTVVVNPRIIKKSKTRSEDWEGDLSANFKALVPRPVSCVVAGLDRYGEPVVLDLDYDFHARVFQHEIDHLNGKLFIDRVHRKDTISEWPEWEKFWKNKKLRKL